MKIIKLHFKNYLNFGADFTIDLTYPVGHEKEGKPLDKVCFIGQSCTGKTSLLNLIKYISFPFEEIDKSCIQEDLLADGAVEVFYEIGRRKFSKKIKEDGTMAFLENDEIQQPEFEKIIMGSLQNKPWLINFPFNIIEQSDIGTKRISRPETTMNLEQRILLARSRNIWDFAVQNINDLWDIVSEQISFYKKNLEKEKDKLIDGILHDETNQEKYKAAFRKWQEENRNPIKKLADACLNDLLAELHLKPKTDLNYEDEEDLKFVKLLLRGDNNKHIQHQYISTGAKQLILTAIPLFFLAPNEAIILFDQPESSLFPDIQIKLIEHYQTLANNSQFFYATHSPVIASSFEPCERIILYFDEDGKVNYRKGDAPEGDDPNDLLHRDFGMNNLLGKKGLKNYERFIELKTLIRSENDGSGKEILMNEFLEINSKYKFTK
jgi:ABC-type lipoprotein export system ATPase subunit